MLIQEIYNYLLKNWINISLIVLILLIMTIFIVLENVQFNNENNSQVNNDKTTHTSTIRITEAMTNEEKLEKTHKEMVSKMKKGFCGVHEGNSDNLENDCNALSKETCNMTECCIFAYNSKNQNGKCVAGSESGPTYQTDDSGMEHNFDYYYYMGKKYN